MYFIVFRLFPHDSYVYKVGVMSVMNFTNLINVDESLISWVVQEGDCLCNSMIGPSLNNLVKRFFSDIFY